MIASWMIYSILVALCLGVAASAAEHLIRLYGKPARAVWVVALVGSLLVPLVNWTVVNRADGVADGAQAMPLLPVIATSLLSSPLQAYAPATPVLAGFDSMLAIMWLAMSLALVALVVGSIWRLKRERRGWHTATLEGKQVLVSNHVGPAVIGLFNHEVVVPDWLLELSAGMRRVALRHEEEHVRAGDLRLIMLASLAVLLFPWNISLWWQLRRMRTALEADCDARVLGQGGDLRTYGTLLLEVGSRAWYPRFATLALIERKSSLARRIEIMTLKPRLKLAQAGVAVVLAGTFALLACETPVPSQMSDAEADVLAGVYADTEVDSPPERISSPPLEYPRLLQQAGIEGHVLLQGIVGVDGRVEPGSVEILESTHQAFELPSKSLLEGTLFRPAKVDGEAVRTLIQLPIQFTLIGGPDDKTPEPPEGGVGLVGVKPS
jgi:beta-lactamase regulating signal transducer with metallopeptidase domain